MEHIFWLLNRSAGNQIVLAAEIEGETTLRAWRQALNALQRRHPLLSTTITLSSNGLPYFEGPSVQEIPLRFATDAIWGERAIATEWLDSQMADELAEPFDTVSAPLIRAALAITQYAMAFRCLCASAIC
jgi:hypothetical protein